jgi:hypothetical protein
MNWLAWFFAALLTEDDHDKVPDLVRVLWFIGGVLALLGIIVFFALALIEIGRPHRDWTFLAAYAGAYATLFAGYGAFMRLCAGALAIKTRSGA